MKGQKVMTSSASVEWSTPRWLFDQLHHEFLFDLDPCCTHANAKCNRHFTAEDDGLKQSWAGRRAFMNPPYGGPEAACRPNCKKKRCESRGHHVEADVPGCADWVKKAFTSVMEERALVVGLLPARTDTRWWHEWIEPHRGRTVEVRFLEGRLCHGSPSYPDGDPRRPSPFPSVVVVWRPPIAKLKEPRR